MSGWTPNYRPSNGSEGDIFEHLHCTGCTADECDVMLAALISDDGPDQWEWMRTADGYETRCTARTTGEIVTDDKLRADRMTRALAKWPMSREDSCPFCGKMGEPLVGSLGSFGPIDHADDCPWIEANRWVDANPEPAAAATL